MANELLGLLEYIEEERGISREELVSALEKALVSAGRKSVTYGKTLEVKVDPVTGEIKAWVTMEVVEEKPNIEQIALPDARRLSPGAKVGDIVSKAIPPQEFGRIAAQTAKQTMMQQLRKAEKAKVFDEFKDSIGKIVSGIVRRFEAGSVIVDFQKAEGILTYKEKIPGESYMVGDRLNALLINVDPSGSGPSLILSRSNPEFVRRLFEREVAEIGDGVVEIKAIAREPGVRTKIAVLSKDTKVDPIGACVGMRGSRVKNITTELCGERIDIVRFDERISEYVVNAMQPASPKSVEVDEASKTVTVHVDQTQVRLAIGRNWQNVKLCSQLVGYKVNVVTIPGEETQTIEEKIGQAVTVLSEKLGVSAELAEKLLQGGYSSVDGLFDSTEADLVTVGATPDEAKKIIEVVKVLKTQTPEPPLAPAATV